MTGFDNAFAKLSLGHVGEGFKNCTTNTDPTFNDFTVDVSCTKGTLSGMIDYGIAKSDMEKCANVLSSKSDKVAASFFDGC